LKSENRAHISIEECGVWSRDDIEAAGDHILQAMHRGVDDAYGQLDALRGPAAGSQPQQQVPQTVRTLAVRTGLERDLLVLAAKRLELAGRLKGTKHGGETWFSLVE
jgi:hypothetical protein